MKAFKVGDKVYLKNEAQYKRKRVWEITGKREDGVFTLSRKIRSFLFIEFAKSNEIVHNE